MKRPPMRIDGRSGALRWISAEGHPRSMSGRLSFLATNWASGVISGTGRDYEIRLLQGPWHRIEATPDEIKAYIIANTAGNRTRRYLATNNIRRCEALRERRIERGLPVTS